MFFNLRYLYLKYQKKVEKSVHKDKFICYNNKK